MSYETGFFGIPGKVSTGKVHITYLRRPICKARHRKDANFQMCSNGVRLSSVECKRCISVWEKRAAQMK